MTEQEAADIGERLARQISDGNLGNMRKMIADCVRFHAIRARDQGVKDAASWLAPNFPGQARDLVKELCVQHG